MANTGLKGPYELTDKSINENVTLTSAGAYALGESRNGTFYVSYVGRSDDDVNDRLHDWAGKYETFKFDYFDLPKAAFEKECRLYHDFGGSEGKLDNKEHPDRPDNSSWQCSVCNIFKSESW